MAFPPPGDVVSDFNIADFGPCNCPLLAYKNGGVPVPHWRSLLESKYLSHYDLDGKDCTVVIKEIKGKQKIVGKGGKEDKKALVSFVGKERAAVMGPATLSVIASIYGDDWANWTGKAITLYPTTTSAGGDGAVGCIRVRPTAPKGKPAPAQREPGGEG